MLLGMDEKHLENSHYKQLPIEINSDQSSFPHASSVQGK